MFEDDVAPIDVPEFSKTFKKARVIRPFFRSTTRMPKNTNSGNSAGLRTRKAWQRYRTADGCKEITSSHRLRLDAPAIRAPRPPRHDGLDGPRVDRPGPFCRAPSMLHLGGGPCAGRIRRPTVKQHRFPLPVSKLTIASDSRPRREHPVGGVIFHVPTRPCQTAIATGCGTTASPIPDSGHSGELDPTPAVAGLVRSAWFVPGSRAATGRINSEVIPRAQAPRSATVCRDRSRRMDSR